MFKRLRENLFGRQPADDVDAPDAATMEPVEVPADEAEPEADAGPVALGAPAVDTEAGSAAEVHETAPPATMPMPGALRGPFAPPSAPLSAPPVEVAGPAAPVLEPPSSGTATANPAPPSAPVGGSSTGEAGMAAVREVEAPSTISGAGAERAAERPSARVEATVDAPAARVASAPPSSTPAPSPVPEARTTSGQYDRASVIEADESADESADDYGAEATDDEELDAEELDADELGEAQPGRVRGFFKNPFHFSLGRTRQLFGRVNEALAADDITPDLWDELEETLISADVGVALTERLLTTLRERVDAEGLTRGTQLRDALKEELDLLLGDPEPLVYSDTSPITVILVVGVNGVGKTTSIAKLANGLKRQKHRVMLAAGDTFRAAATEQIKIWGERVGVPVISHQYGADPAAVVYDAMQAAQARGSDVLIVDTAGRLHTKFNLMEELKKIVRVLQKYDPEAPHEVLLVIDATTGQNGYLQAKQFTADAGVSGIVLTKLDSTARGGIVFAIASELGLPIKYIGTGEKVGDFAAFEPVDFVDALFEAD